MHYSRIVGLVGVVVAAIGLFLQSASSGAEAEIPGAGGATFMQATSEATAGAVPAEFDSVWGAIYGEVAAGGIVLALALLAVVALALIPPMKEAPVKMYAMVLTILGVIALVISGYATNKALGDADDLQNAYAQMAAGGAIPEAFGVSISMGWVLLIVGSGVAAIAGLLAFMNSSDGLEEDEPAADAA